MGNQVVVDEDYIKELDAQVFQARAREAQSSQGYATTAMYSQQQKPNLVEWQLSFNEVEQIEHYLRNDIFIRGKNGQSDSWQPNPNKAEVYLNDKGVNDVLRTINMIINKNTVLSNYDKLEIKERMKVLAHELRQLIYRNQEAYEFDNEYKWNQYESIVMSLVRMAESSYRRALNGEERRDLNSARVVNQSEPISNGNQGMMYQQMNRKKSVFKPWTW